MPRMLATECRNHKRNGRVVVGGQRHNFPEFSDLLVVSPAAWGGVSTVVTFCRLWSLLFGCSVLRTFLPVGSLVSSGSWAAFLP